MGESAQCLHEESTFCRERSVTIIQACFFQKHGYSAEWTSVNMELELAEFSIHALICRIPRMICMLYLRLIQTGICIFEAIDDVQTPDSGYVMLH